MLPYILSKKNKKNFEKPIDKQKKVWYNVITLETK